MKKKLLLALGILMTFLGGYVFGLIMLGIEVLIWGGPVTFHYAGLLWLAFAIGLLITRAVLKKYFPDFVGSKK